MDLSRLVPSMKTQQVSNNEFHFDPPSTPKRRDTAAIFEYSPPSFRHTGPEKENGKAVHRSPLLSNVGLSLTDWLPVPLQAHQDYSRSRLRWAVRTKDWQPSLREWSFMLSLLPQSDQDQISEFKFLEDRKRRLVSSLMQRKCISVALGVKWSQIRIRRTKGKKPWVVCEGIEKDHAPNFNFNVSHEGDYVVLSSEPLCICGIDVSAPRQFRGQRQQSVDNLLAGLKNVFTPREMLAIRAAGKSEEDRLQAFRRYWSLKEALGKARGDGLGMDFQRAEFHVFEDASGWKATVKIDGLHKPNWRFDLQELAGGHWMSVGRGPPEDIVDAWGDFLDSLERPNLPRHLLQEALNAPNPPLSILQPQDLIPSAKVLEYESIMEEEC